MTQRGTFEWDDDEEHIAKHGVDRYEAMEASEDPEAFVKRVGGDRYGNPRYIYVGKTEDGRIYLWWWIAKVRTVFVSGARGMPSSRRRRVTGGGAKVKAYGAQAG